MGPPGETTTLRGATTTKEEEEEKALEDDDFASSSFFVGGGQSSSKGAFFERWERIRTAVWIAVGRIDFCSTTERVGFVLSRGGGGGR